MACIYVTRKEQYVGTSAACPHPPSRTQLRHYLPCCGHQERHGQLFCRYTKCRRLPPHAVLVAVEAFRCKEHSTWRPSVHSMYFPAFCSVVLTGTGTQRLLLQFVAQARDGVSRTKHSTWQSSETSPCCSRPLAQQR